MDALAAGRDATVQMIDPPFHAIRNDRYLRIVLKKPLASATRL
jgi:hypothetical protein